jgi:uncharacterized protein (TIGR02145 family)
MTVWAQLSKNLEGGTRMQKNIKVTLARGRGASAKFRKCRTISIALCSVALAVLGIYIYKITQSVFYAVEYKPQPITTMQDMTTTICGEMSMYSTLILKDTRNNQDYRIRKMPDSHCWMVDNLKLATPGAPLTITPADSNVTSNFTIPANPVQGITTHSNGRCDSGGTLANGDGWLTCDGTNSQSAPNNGFAAYSDPSDPSVAGTESCVARKFIDPASLTGCGYLYNWYTATAGTGTYAIDGTAGNDSVSDICPVGWRLPKNDGSDSAGSDVAMLNAKMNNPNATQGSIEITTTYAKNWWYAGPFAGSFSGDYGGVFENQGMLGVFWTSSAISVNIIRHIDFRAGIIYPSTASTPKTYGVPVRCLI